MIFCCGCLFSIICAMSWTDYWTGGKTKDFSKKYRGKTFVDDVEYEVKEESAEDENNQ